MSDLWFKLEKLSNLPSYIIILDLVLECDNYNLFAQKDL
jgi:hypothetical protein